MSIEERILEVVKQKGEASLSDLYAAIPGFPKPSVRSKASILASKGLLHRVKKGVYALSEEAMPAADTPGAEDTSGEPAADAAEATAPAEDTGSGASTTEADTRGEDNAEARDTIPLSVPARKDTEGEAAEKEDTPRRDTSAEDTAPASRKLRKRVLRLLRRQPDATPEEVAEVLSASTDTIRRIIGELIDHGELEPPGEGGAATPAEERNIRSAKCFYAPVCFPGMRKVCEAVGSLLCEQQKTAGSATATS